MKLKCRPVENEDVQHQNRKQNAGLWMSSRLFLPGSWMYEQFIKEELQKPRRWISRIWTTDDDCSSWFLSDPAGGFWMPCFRSAVLFGSVLNRSVLLSGNKARLWSLTSRCVGRASGLQHFLQSISNIFWKPTFKTYFPFKLNLPNQQTVYCYKRSRCSEVFVLVSSLCIKTAGACCRKCSNWKNHFRIRQEEAKHLIVNVCKREKRF